MLISELVDTLSYCLDDVEVVVEVNGVQHTITAADETSQALILVVDTDQEEREMR